MEIEVEELNALRSPFGYILATMNVDLDDSPSSGGCPASPTVPTSGSPTGL
jgi:hypothetical protein